MRDLNKVPFDQYQRYQICKNLIDEFSGSGVTVKVLDIGGYTVGPDGKGWLPAVEFMPQHEVIVIDTVDSSIENYIKGDGGNLPYDDNSFDFVITNDVLEHVLPNDRESFLREIIRVSRYYVILNFPYYTAKNELAEKILHEYSINVFNYENKMLYEHILNGLPTINSIDYFLDHLNLKYCHYFSSDVDNWVKLMGLRFWLEKHRIEPNVIDYIHAYYNEFHFDSDMNLDQGYRVTYIIAKSEKDILIKHNFFEKIGKEKKNENVQLPISSIIELLKLRMENDNLEKLDSFYSNATNIIPRMLKGSMVSQSFKCYSRNLCKLGFLAGTFFEQLSGTAKVTLIEKESSKVVFETSIQYSMILDNDWFYITFPPLFDSIEKTFEVVFEQLSEYPGPTLYYSSENEYGKLLVCSESIDGGLTAKIFCKQMSMAENYFYINQLNRNLHEQIRDLKSFIKEKDAMISKKDTIISEKDAVLSEKDAMLSEKDTVLSEKDAMLSEKDAIILEKDAMILEKDAMIADKGKALINREQIILDKSNELIFVYGTRSWKITKPLRWISHNNRQVCKCIRLSKRLIMENGGFVRGSFFITRKIFGILRRYGFYGLKQKIKDNIKTQKINTAIQYSQYEEHKFNTVKVVLLPPPLQVHQAMVDIIICVHNALDDVKRCLNSVLRYTNPPYSLILVDDGSSDETKVYLSAFCVAQGATLIRNDIAKGYTFAANQGLRNSNGDYVVLLNSDTIVTLDWIDRMVQCVESNPAIGLVGPLSNTASWQSIPKLEEDGDWANNSLPESISISDMGLLVAKYSSRLYPRISFLNGFCLLIKREVINHIGYFDEETFGRGYGEENDYCLRARKSGWDLAVADDAYIYHAQSRSYSHERRKMLCEQAGIALAKKHGQQIIDNGVTVCRYDRVLEGIRARNKAMLRRTELINDGLNRWEGKRVLFVLPIMDAGGGGNVVIQEAESMLEMGVDVRILNLERHRQAFEKSYLKHNLRIPIVYAKNENEISRIASSYDAVIATANHSVAWLDNCQKDGCPVRVYYIQDFEPYFFDEGSENYKIAWDSYTLFEDLIRITKTEWNLNEVKRNIGVDCVLVGSSVNIDLFRPRLRHEGNWPKRPLRIAAMIRPSTPRRNPKFSMEILREISIKHGSSIEIILFGCLSEDPDFVSLPHDFVWRNYGILSREGLSWLLNEIDIFVDFSMFQAMGLTAMEAMSCGVAIIAPQYGGAGSFVVNEENGFLVDSKSHNNCIQVLNRLILDEGLRTRIQQRALRDICLYNADKVAYKMLEAIWG